MIEETAIVVTCSDNKALLEVQRQSTCNSCNAKSGCGTALFAKTLGKKVSQITVENTLNLQAGDKVIVGMQENAFLTGSIIIYLLPLIMMLLFAVLGQWFTEQVLLSSSELLTITFAIAGFIIAMKMVSRFSQKIKNDSRYHAVVIRKLII